MANSHFTVLNYSGDVEFIAADGRRSAIDTEHILTENVLSLIGTQQVLADGEYISTEDNSSATLIFDEQIIILEPSEAMRIVDGRVEIISLAEAQSDWSATPTVNSANTKENSLPDTDRDSAVTGDFLNALNSEGDKIDYFEEAHAG